MSDDVRVEAGRSWWSGRSGMLGRRSLSFVRGLVVNYGILLLLVGLVAGIAAAQPNFVDPTNLLNLLQQWAPVGIMAIAGTFVVIAGGFDLSVGGTYALAAVIVASLTESHSLPLALAAALSIGLGVGLLNGLVVTKAHVNPFIATLGTGQVVRGAAFVYTAAAPVVVADEAFGILGTEKLGPLAISSIIFLGLLAIGGLVLAKSAYGRKVYAVGGNREASILTGIRADRIVISTYVLSGLSAALAGIIVASRLGQGIADLGELIEFDVIIAIVLGGTAISGGVGAIWRTAVGVALLAVMQNGFDTLRVNPFWQILIKGAILVGAVAWDEYVTRRKESAA